MLKPEWKFYMPQPIFWISLKIKKGGGDRDSEKWYNCLTVNQI